MIDNARLDRTLGLVGEFLVGGKYSKLEELSQGIRLTASQMQFAVDSYGRTLVLPPEGFSARSVVAIDNALPRKWSVYVDLWTKEEGRSDLTLELTVIESEGELFSVEIDDIHVL